jgi:hypothetical protein
MEGAKNATGFIDRAGPGSLAGLAEVKLGLATLCVLM